MQRRAVSRAIKTIEAAVAANHQRGFTDYAGLARDGVGSTPGLHQDEACNVVVDITTDLALYMAQDPEFSLDMFLDAVRMHVTAEMGP